MPTYSSKVYTTWQLSVLLRMPDLLAKAIAAGDVVTDDASYEGNVLVVEPWPVTLRGEGEPLPGRRNKSDRKRDRASRWR